MNDPPKKRPWFQFSLMTAVVMMLTAGVLLGLNMFPRVREVDLPKRHLNENVNRYGWPFSFISERKSLDGEAKGWDYWTDDQTFTFTAHVGIVNATYFSVDLLICIGVLAILGYFCEYLVRRNDRLRKQREASKP